VPPPATLPDAINGVLALIDDRARWPNSAKATRACSQLRKALIAAIDVLKSDAVPATLPDNRQGRCIFRGQRRRLLAVA
jgi:hypothetical protein